MNLIRVEFPFAHDGFGVFVVSQTEEDRLAQDAVAGPLAELYLGYELRRGEVRFGHFTGHRNEGRGLAGDCVEFGADFSQELRIEARADVADVDEVVTVVDTEQERAERSAAAPWIGPTPR